VKPAIALGFGLLLLFFIAGSLISEEPEPFDRIPAKSTYLELAGVGQLWEQDLGQYSTNLPGADLPDWEKEQLLHWARYEWIQGLPRPDLNEFLDAIREAHETYLFATDDRGTVLRGEGGNFLARAHPIQEEDHLRWHDQLETRMNELLLQWERETQVVYQELLSSLDSADIPEVQAAAGTTVAEYKSGVHREFERLYRQAESQFIRLRLEQASKAADEPPTRDPGSLARSLIAQTQAERRDSEALAQTDPELISHYQQLPLVLDAQSWKEEFCQAFERGIETWSRAEQSFLDERVRWETSARQRFAETERAWRKASAEFDKARESWIEEMQSHLEQGTLRWEQAESDFLARFDLEMKQTAAAAKEELDRLDRDLATLLALYGQNLDLMEVAEQKTEYLRSEIAELEEANDPDRLDSLLLLREELAYWQGEDGTGGLLDKCRESLGEAQTALIEVEAEIRCLEAGTIPSNQLEREIARLNSELLYLYEQPEDAAATVTPDRVIAQRAEARERIDDALEILKGLTCSAVLDPGYVELKDRELDLLNAQQILLFARQRLRGSIGDLEAALAANRAALETSIGRIFRFTPGLRYTPPQDQLDVEGLTDFSLIEDSLLPEAVTAYFAGEEAEISEKFSRDATVWLTAMAELEAGFQESLRSFGLAYYYDAELQNDLSADGAPKIEIPILKNPNFTVLAEDYLDLGPETQTVLLYHGKLVDKVTVYPESKFLPKDYLAKVSAGAFDQIQADAHVGRLYAFFKAMLASGHFAPGTDFICDDLTDLAYNYIEQKARDLQNDWEEKWWLFKRRKAR
jgi:hypothetical protein